MGSKPVGLGNHVPEGEVIKLYWMERRDAKRRLIIKRQLRRRGIVVPESIVGDLTALRAFRRAAL
jgi:hypothetical protein